VRILALTRYTRRGASSRLRFEQFVPALAREGIDVELSPLLDDAFLLRRYSGRGANAFAALGAYASRVRRLHARGGWDLIWLEKEALPWLPDLLERRLAPFDVPFVVDFDDAWFHRYDVHKNPIVRGLLGGKLDAIMRRAAVVCAGNEYIADRARQAGASRIEILPTVVDASRYPVSRASRPGNPFVVGWIGTPLTAAYLREITGALAAASQRYPLRLRAVGAGPLAIAGVDVETLPWSERDEATTIGGFDVGVMPLPDSPWERGKCGYKLLQYMACGKPVVASPVGVNRAIVSEGGNGFLATDVPSWTRALVALHDDPARASSMGAAGRRLVERDYDLPGASARLASILRGAVRGGSR
jgi:glycosyltransferase involved in cell wall biosynthesis